MEKSGASGSFDQSGTQRKWLFVIGYNDGYVRHHAAIPSLLFS
jgi:hypothetical protein